MKRLVWAVGIAAAVAGAAALTVHAYRVAHAPLGDAGKGLCVESEPYTGYWQRRVGGLEYTDFKGRTHRPHPIRVTTPLKCVEAQCADGFFSGAWASYDEVGAPAWRGTFERGRAGQRWQRLRPDGGPAETLALDGGAGPWSGECLLEQPERAH